LLITVSIFDDDTGQAVDLDFSTTVNLAPFTGSAWTITDGSIVTTSVTPITIPVYPIGNQLSALALTVGSGLAINPGDPIKIADTATSLNFMLGYVLSYTSSSGALSVQIGCTFDFEIRRVGPRMTTGGYVPYFDWGVPDEHGPLLQATLGNGIQIIDIGVIQILIPAATFQKLRGGTYQAALVMSDSVNTRQVFVANLPVAYGGVQKLPMQNATANPYNPNIF
jgi:hypothetical protein